MMGVWSEVRRKIKKRGCDEKVMEERQEEDITI